MSANGKTERQCNTVGKKALTTAILDLYKRTECTLDPVDSSDYEGSAGLLSIALILRGLSQALQALLANDDDTYLLETEILLQFAECHLYVLSSLASSMTQTRTQGIPW